MLLDRMKGWNVDVVEQTVNIYNKHGYDISLKINSTYFFIQFQLLRSG